MLYYENENVKLYHGDCLKVMPELADSGLVVDMCLTDPPYQVSACAWDKIIPPYPMFDAIWRILKFQGAACLFCQPPFSADLITACRGNFKYTWYWEKSAPNGFVHAKNRPMSIVEEIAVFSQAPMGHASLLGDRRMIYNPQGIKSAGLKKVSASKGGRITGPRPNQTGREYEAFTGFHSNVIHCPNFKGKAALHPTQKPVQLLEYLIKCYTSEGDTILDFACGSGSTGIAAMRSNRKCILIEMDEEACELAANRLSGVIL